MNCIECMPVMRSNVIMNALTRCCTAFTSIFFGPGWKLYVCCVPYESARWFRCLWGAFCCCRRCQLNLKRNRQRWHEYSPIHLSNPNSVRMNETTFAGQINACENMLSGRSVKQNKSARRGEEHWTEEKKICIMFSSGLFDSVAKWSNNIEMHLCRWTPNGFTICDCEWIFQRDQSVVF